MLDILFQFELSKNIKQAKKLNPKLTYLQVLTEVGKASPPTHRGSQIQNHVWPPYRKP